MPVWKTTKGYEVSIPIGRYKNGRVKYKREIYADELTARQRDKELLKEIKQLNFILTHQEKKAPDVLFKEMALKWLKIKRLEVAHKTWERYEQIVDLHILPAFEKDYVEDITEDKIREYFCTQQNSSTTLQQHYTILKNTLKLAGSDVMKNIKRPQKNNTEINCIKDPAELANFINSFKNSVLFLPVYIAAVTGMRLSEIAGLRWVDVDFNQAHITVNRSLHWKTEDNVRLWYVKSTKNGSSKRTIKISSKDVEVLQRFEGKKGDFICLDSNNNPICAQHISPNFKARAKIRGYDVTFHSLRHSHATILIQYYKKSINAVSKRLGHTNIITTLTIYTSILPREDGEIADTMGEVMCNVLL